MKASHLLLGLGLLAASGAQRPPAPRPAAADYPFQNPDLAIDQRVDDLVGRLTLAEKR